LSPRTRSQLPFHCWLTKKFPSMNILITIFFLLYLLHIK
jgi:hypothetical protein